MAAMQESTLMTIKAVQGAPSTVSSGNASRMALQGQKAYMGHTWSAHNEHKRHV